MKIHKLSSISSKSQIWDSVIKLTKEIVWFPSPIFWSWARLVCDLDVSAGWPQLPVIPSFKSKALNLVDKMLGLDQMIKQLMIWFEVLAEPWQLHRWSLEKQSILQMHCFESDFLKGKLDPEQWKFFWARAETLECSLIRVERIRVWSCF